MNLSVRLRLILLGLLAIILTATIAIVLALVFFRSQVEELYEQDFLGRVESLEFEYSDVDAVSAATDEVYTLQQDLLQRLERRFEGRQGARPFIFNGEGEIILWPDDQGIERTAAEQLLELAAPADGDAEIGADSTHLTATINTGEREFWFVVNYYESWDWFTGYAISNSERFAVLRRFLIVLGGGVLGLAVLAIAGFILVLGRMLAPLAQVQNVMRSYADGDLRPRVDVRRNDEFGRIAAGVNESADNLGAIVQSIFESSHASSEVEKSLNESSQVASTEMGEITDGTRAISGRVDRLNELMITSNESVERITSEIGSLSERIEDQFAAVTESTASIEEMSSSLGNVAAITQSKRQASERLMKTAHEGGEQLQQTTGAIEALLQKVDAISEFVVIIQGVASQTNLLAMNAAIEAAHAGEAGRGFAVVADEIRKLAEEAATHSTSTAASITEIVDQVRAAARAGGETREAFEEIEREIQTVANSLDEIAASASELSTGSDEVMNAMQILQDISTHVRAGSDAVQKEATSVSGAISDLADLSSEVKSLSSSIAERAEGAAGAIGTVRNAVGNLHEATEALSEQIHRFTVE